MRDHTRRFLDCSTAHISVDTWRWLHERGKEVFYAVDAQDDWLTGSPKSWVAITPFGWFIYADEEPDPTEFPLDLIVVMRQARALGCEYILFDRDAAPIADLPTYEEGK